MLFIIFGISYSGCCVIATMVTHMVSKIFWQSRALRKYSHKNHHPQGVHKIYVLETFVRIQYFCNFNAILANYCALLYLFNTYPSFDCVISTSIKQNFHNFYMAAKSSLSQRSQVENSFFHFLNADKRNQQQYMT